jgi:hypothetical protein
MGAVGGVDSTAAVGTSGTSNISGTCAKTTPYNVALVPTNNSTTGLGTLVGTGGNTDTLRTRA